MDFALILELIDNKQYASARREIIQMNVVDIAGLLELLDKHKLVTVFRMLPKEISAEVFSYISPEQQRYIVETVTDKEVQHIINELFLDDTVDFLEEMPASVVKKVLANTDEETRREINILLNYPEDSAGSIMTIEYVDLKRQMTAADAITYIRRCGFDKETIETCYVIDENRVLEGVISLRKLILSNPDTKVSEIMDSNVMYIKTLDDREAAANLFHKYGLMAMPVVDNEQRLVGIITVDDIVDIIVQESTEDFQKMAAMTPTEEEYIKTSPWELARHRVLWLLVLMISSTFTGTIIRGYENLLSASVLLASFIPMLMNTGGNAGSQASTLIIRGMALSQISSKDILRILRKEFTVGIIAGSILGVLNFLKLTLVDNLLFNVGISFNVALAVCLCLCITVVIAKVVGGILPVIAKTLRLDPAIMASPFITTVVDAMTLMIYFNIATVLLNLS